MENNQKRGDIPTLVIFFVAGWIVNILGSVLAVLPYAGIYDIAHGIFPGLGYSIMAIGAAIVATKYFGVLKSARVSGLQVELSEVIKRAQEEPNKVKPAWDLARVRLELYFDRNLSQINYIFWLSVVAMLVGFCFILFAIIGFEAKSQEGRTISATSPATIAGVAGVITEFIGATFLVIYRSTIEQASKYTQTLERINSVGMAMQILDSISQEATGLRDQTKAEIVKLLLAHSEAVAKDPVKRAPTEKNGKKSTLHEETKS